MYLPAIAVVALLGAVPACKRAPPDDDAMVAAILARHPVDPSLHRDWLERDLRMFLALRRDLEPYVSAASKRTRVVCAPSGDARACEEFRHLEDIYGGYSTCREDIFTHDAAVAGMHLDCSSSAESWPLVVPLVLDALGGVGEAEERGVRYVFQDDALMAKARADMATDLGTGPLLPVVVPPELAEAYDTLTSPFSALDLGEGCSEIGRPGRGHAETAALVKAGRLDLLRNVGRGLNGEGRVFAALALYEHARPWTPEDVALIQKVRASSHLVRRCQGCSGGFENASNLVPDPSASQEPR